MARTDTLGGFLRGPGRARAGRVARLAGAAVAYAACVAWLAWPLVLQPATLVKDHVAGGAPLAHWAALDRALGAWVLSWTARAVVEQPLAVFDANLFHPAPDTLASSENLLGLLPVAAPVYLASGNPVLTHNVTAFVLVWTLALMSFVAVRAWSGSAAAGLPAGALAAFSPLVVAEWSNVISGTAVHLVPLVLLLGWRAARHPRASRLAALAAAVALQVLSGLYVAYQLLAVLLPFVPGAWLEARRRGRSLRPAALAIAVGFLVLVPVCIPYLRVRAHGVLPDAATARAIVASLAPSADVGWRTVTANLGWTGVLLALLGAVAPGPPLRLRASLVAAAALTFLLSGGPDVPLLPGTSLPGLYEIAMHVVPGFASMRAAGRFLIVTVLLLALLAGLGAASLPRALGAGFGARGRRAGRAALLLATLLVVVARGREPSLPVTRLPATPDAWNAYGWLRHQGGDGALLELPAMVSPLDARDAAATATYLLGAAIHGRPVLNGYSGHAPRSAALLMSLAQRLPDPRAFDELCALTDLRWIALHADVAPELRAVWRDVERTLPLAPVPGFFGPVVLYRVARPCGDARDALRVQLAAPATATSLHGHALAPLDADARRGRVAARVTTLPAGLHAWLAAEITNDGPRTWPGAALDAPGAVRVQARLRDPVTGREVAAPAVPIPLGVDLAPGETLRVRVGVQAPGPGDYRLEVGLVQSGVGWFADQPGGGALLAAPVRVRALGVGGAAVAVAKPEADERHVRR